MADLYLRFKMSLFPIVTPPLPSLGPQVTAVSVCGLLYSTAPRSPYSPDFPFGEHRVCHETSLSRVTTKHLKTATKIEIFNSAMGKWGEISVTNFKILQNSGLTEEKLIQLNSALARARTIDGLGYDYDSFIEALTNYIGTMHAGKSSELHVKEFWDLVDTLNRTDIPDLVKDGCFFDKGPRPLSLILKAFKPGDPAFNPYTLPNLDLIARIHRFGSFCTKTISSLQHLCQSIKEGSLYGLKHLVLQAHGDELGMTIPDAKESPSVFSRLKECFSNFTQKSVPTIILNSCKTGKGGPTAFNFANHIANSAPKGTHIIASTDDVMGFSFEPEQKPPHSLEFRNQNDLESDFVSHSTYHIDTSTPSPKLCPPDAISLLDICSEFPLFRLHQTKKGAVIHFQSMFHKRWEIVSSVSWQFLKTRAFNNIQLEAISRSSLSLSEFIRRAKKHPIELNASDLIEAILKK